MGTADDSAKCLGNGVEKHLPVLVSAHHNLIPLQSQQVNLPPLAILCPELEDPENGFVETTDNRVGDVADYQCDYGFALEGDSQRACLLSGEWSGEAPTCVGKQIYR